VTPAWWIFFAVLLEGAAGLAGGFFSEGWLRRNLSTLVGFAAGALIAAVFLDLLPDAIETHGRGALAWALGGFLALALLEWALGQHHHGPRDGRALPAALLASDALHNTGDGAALAAAFLVSPHAGLAVAIAVIAHEVPQEIGDYVLLRAAGMSKRRALFWLALVQFTAGAGALAVVLASKAGHDLTAVLIAIASGTFLYIGATDLLPELHTGARLRDRVGPLVGFVLGVALLALATLTEGGH
jgi:zinc and cadmium transporter